MVYSALLNIGKGVDSLLFIEAISIESAYRCAIERHPISFVLDIVEGEQNMWSMKHNIASKPFVNFLKRKVLQSERDERARS